MPRPVGPSPFGPAEFPHSRKVERMREKLRLWERNKTPGEDRKTASRLILDCFEHKKNKLKLSCNLEELPPVFEELAENLQYLDLSHNRFTRFPPSLLKMIILLELDLSHNGLVTISDEIHEMIFLNRLDVSHNKLTTLPAALLKMLWPKEVYVGENKFEKDYFAPFLGRNSALRLESLKKPEEVSHLAQPGMVAASRTLVEAPMSLRPPQVSDIEWDVERWVRDAEDKSEMRAEAKPLIIQCYINNEPTLVLRCNLRELPENVIAKLTKLKLLDLSGNALRALSPKLRALTSLEGLLLANNDFDRVPEVALLFPKLRKLDVSHNVIEVLPAELSVLPLEELDLSHNIFKHFPDAAQLPRTLTKLDISYNPTDETLPDIDSLVALKSINTNGTKIWPSYERREELKKRGLEFVERPSHQIPETYLLGVSSDLDRFFRENCDYSIGIGLARSRINECIRHQFAVVNGSGVDFDRIGAQNLVLSNIDLEYLPAIFDRLIWVAHVDASRNRLRSLPPRMGEMTSLRTLDVSNNGIKAFPLRFAKLGRVKVINACGNPLDPSSVEELRRKLPKALILTGDAQQKIEDASKAWASKTSLWRYVQSRVIALMLQSFSRREPVLDLSGHGLQSIPQDVIAQFSWVKELKLSSGNSFSAGYIEGLKARFPGIAIS